MDQPRTVSEPDGQAASLLGPEYPNEEIRLFLSSTVASYEQFTDETELLETVAKLIDQGKIIGWFQGRMEFGPRALGCRSILGDARNADTQQTMNLKIKFRESFRPFAPCVLREHVSEIFETRPLEDSPYMLLVAPVRENLRLPLNEEQQKRMESNDLHIRAAVPRSVLPAITHVDYSARIQTVDKDRHGRYYRLMKHFYDLTGCPVIVNTSFNIRGEPIVCTPEDAFRCFLATDMDALVMGDFLILRNDQPKELLETSEDYRNQYALD
jgi:carbamoyltransferase